MPNMSLIHPWGTEEQNVVGGLHAVLCPEAHVEGWMDPRSGVRQGKSNSFT